MGAPHFDVAVVGGGIAGVAAAAGASRSSSVVLLEQEAELALHTTSRSAAVYTENEGGPTFHRLSTASRPFWDDPPADGPLITPLGVLKVGDDALRDDFAAEVMAASKVTPSIRLVEGTDLQEICPSLNLDAVTIGMYEPTGGAIDVMGTHQLFLRTARSRGAKVWRSARVNGATRSGERWTIETDNGEARATTIVNAAGAWGDVVAERCGVQPVGLQPMRRTAFTTTIRDDPSGWPLVYSAIPELQCYFKPEAGRQLLGSLADEQLSEPCDARAEEIDVALAIDRINTISSVGVRSVNTTWAGLRTFAPDRNPVFGWDDEVEGFLWLVGQGGCGIVTSPIASDIVDCLLRHAPLPTGVRELGLTAADLAPRRS